jgi:hypothetical protein
MKRIIVCCDGTWNADDTQTNDTNAALLARAIHGSQQTGPYQPETLAPFFAGGTFAGLPVVT